MESQPSLVRDNIIPNGNTDIRMELNKSQTTLNPTIEWP